MEDMTPNSDAQTEENPKKLSPWVWVAVEVSAGVLPAEPTTPNP